MKVIERARYGDKQGDGSLIRYEGVATWYSVYCQRGQEHRRSTHETDLKKAKKIHKSYLDKLAAEREGGKRLATPQDAKVTVGMLLDNLERVNRLRGKNAKAKYHALPVRAYFGEMRAASLTPAAVDRYIEAQNAEGYAAATINHQTGILRRALELAHRDGVLPSVIHVQRLPVQNARTGFFERPDLDTVIKSLPDYLQDFTRCANLIAWRRGELTFLKWSDVDRPGGVIRLRPEHSKNGHGRTVVIEGDLRAIIERRWQAREWKDKAGTTHVSDYVFHRQGEPVGDFRKPWAAACIAAGLYRVVGVKPDGTEVRKPTRIFHDLRRSGVRNMIRAGVHERTAMAVSGHRTRAIFDRYNIVSEADLRTAMQRTSEYNAQPTQTNVVPLRPATSTG
jgi:integrase